MTMLKRLSPIAAAVALMITALFVVLPQPASAATTGLSAKQVVAQMGAGWNLGNTLDATGSGLNAETSWGNPTTTKAMIDAVKAEGFNTVRIPVSWGRHTSGSSYTIDSAWMDRVQEIVDYCIDDGMFVILNIHHDNDKAYFYPNSTYRTQSINYIKSIWKQVSARFKNYDQHLVFEIMNEPRLVGDSSHEWWFPVNSPDSVVSDAIKVINELNQTAVDVIRASGGNNAQRCIMIPGYCASIDGCTTPNFKLPTDSAKDRLIVSVHAYTPYNFCLNGSGTAVFSDSLKSEVDYLFDTINSKFLSKGIPVVIGETSASNKNNASERLKWVDYFYGKAATYGVPCVLWDNNAYNNSDKGEAHGHLDRKALKWYDKSFVDRIVSYFPTSKDLASATVSSISDKTYTGSAIKPAVTVKLNGVTLKSGTDYTVSYSNNIKIGTATVTITGKGDYTGKTTAKFSILPKKVTGVALKARASTALRLSWAKNTDADGYIIEQKSGSQWIRAAKTADNTTTEYRISNLKAGTAYDFRIRAYKTAGGKDYISTYASISARTLPSAVSGLKVKARSSMVIRLSWNKNSSADGYIIEQKNGSEWKRIGKITDNSSTEYRITNLKISTTYSFRIKAYKMNGKSALYSGYKTISATTSPSPVVGFKLKARSSSALRLSWSRHSTADGYVLEQKSGSKWVSIAKLANNTTTECRVTGLKAGTDYSFRLKAYKMKGNTELYSTYKTVSATTSPSAVKGFTLKGRAADALRIGWTKNTSADGYIIEQKINGEWTRIKKITDENVTEYRISGLKADSQYSFRVKAYKMSGKTGLYSGYVNGCWHTSPKAVEGFSVKKAAKSEATLSWSKTNADGVVIEQYSNGKWVKLIDIKNTYTTCRITGLKSKTSYKFRIAAYNIINNKTLYSAKKTLTVKTV